MKATKEDKRRVSGGDLKHLKTLLQKELDDLKKQLAIYRVDKDFDNVIKGKISTAEEILDLF